MYNCFYLKHSPHWDGAAQHGMMIRYIMKQDSFPSTLFVFSKHCRVPFGDPDQATGATQ